MCDEVFYKSEGEQCGIFQKKAGQLFLGTYEHHVCSLGLACFLTKDFQGNDIQQCLTVKKQVGETCLPDYNHCIFTYTCKKNAYDVYTCDAKDLYKGVQGVNVREIYKPSFETNYLTMIFGIILLTLWFMGVLIFMANRYKREKESDEELIDRKVEEQVVF